jgi:hypothetical protein
MMKASFDVMLARFYAEFAKDKLARVTDTEILTAP